MIIKEFDEQEKVDGLGRVLVDMVGDRLGKLINPDTGTILTLPAVYATDQSSKIPEATYPLIQLTPLPYNNNHCYKYDQGLIEVVDPNDTQSLIFLPYYTSYIKHSILLACVGEGSQKILESIRGNMNFDRWKDTIKQEMQSSYQVTTRINKVRTMIDTEWLSQHTMIMNFDTLSTHIDYKGTWFNVIEFDGTAYRVKGDTNPLHTPVKTVGPAYP